jgi:uncharacterized protein (DUF4415 family)
MNSKNNEMEEEYDFSGGKRGAIETMPPGKVRITIRLDHEILDWFRSKAHEAGGGNYQTLINRALLEHIERREESMEEIFRRVLRDELKNGA